MAILRGPHVRLEPLCFEHLEGLCEVGLDPRLWEKTTISVLTREDMRLYVERALRDPESMPFAVVLGDSNQVIGTSRFHHISERHKTLEIGFTWIAPAFQRRGINREIKYLMLGHAFEVLGVRRVELRADRENDVSRAAISSLGALEETTLRNYMVSTTRGPRDVVVYSILSDEWPEIKARLEAKLSERHR